MFWNKFQELCKEKGVSANKVAKDLSIASGTVTEWKKGRTPMNSTLKKVADYFGVPVDVFSESGQKEKPTPQGEPTEDLLVLHRNGKRIEYHLTPEQLAALKPLLDQLDSNSDSDF